MWCCDCSHRTGQRGFEGMTWLFCHWTAMIRGGVESGINTLRPRQDGYHFPDDVFKCIFLNENAWILIKISLRFVPKGPINNIPAFVQIMAWRRPGDKPLSESMMVKLPTHICITRPQWVKHVLVRHILLLNSLTHICLSKLTIIVSDNGLSPLSEPVLEYCQLDP